MTARRGEDGWPWSAVVEQALERLHRLRRLRWRSPDALICRTLEDDVRDFSFRMAAEHARWIKSVRHVCFRLACRNRGEEWARGPEFEPALQSSIADGYMARDAYWFVQQAKQAGFSDLAIRLLFRIEPLDVAPPTVPEDDERPEDDSIAASVWIGEDGEPDPVPPLYGDGELEPIDETLEESTDRIVGRIVEAIDGATAAGDDDEEEVP